MITFGRSGILNIYSVSNVSTYDDFMGLIIPHDELYIIRSRTLTHSLHVSEYFFDILFSFCRYSDSFRMFPPNVYSDVESEMNFDYMPYHICYIHMVSLKNDFSDVG